MGNIFLLVGNIPDICRFLYTGKNFGQKISHRRMRNLRQTDFAKNSVNCYFLVQANYKYQDQSYTLSVKLHTECESSLGLWKNRKYTKFVTVCNIILCKLHSVYNTQHTLCDITQKISNHYTVKGQIFVFNL